MLIATWVFVAACAAAMVAAGFTRNRVPVAASVGVAAVLRIAFALLTSQRWTPHDVRVDFMDTGVAILQGKDPLMIMPGRSWNFLEFMPYIHAAELESGLPWVYAVKIAPIAADLALVWMVSRLAGRDGRTRALQYAVNPLSMLVVALHGQVEPVALALALGGVLVLRKDRPVLAGILLGAAVAAKTWPVVILLAVLPLRQPRRAARVLAGSAVVPVLCLLSGWLFLGTDILRALGRAISYTSFVGEWTWSGTWLVLAHHPKNLYGNNSPLGDLGSVIIAVGVGVTLILLRRRPPEVRALGVLCAVLACTAGFGVQYLLWVAPLAIAISGVWRYGYVLAATGWAITIYVLPIHAPGWQNDIALLSWIPASMLVALIVEQVRRASPELADRDDGSRAGAASLVIRASTGG